jgi:phosphodiesterase/alkaline phosphatase D-like protein
MRFYTLTDASFQLYSFDGNLVEDWSRFPKAQHRLYQAILSSGAQAPVLVSGDVHMAELLRRDCRQHQAEADYSVSRMLLEVTVSGM